MRNKTKVAKVQPTQIQSGTLDEGGIGGLAGRLARNDAQFEMRDHSQNPRGAPKPGLY